MAPWVLPMRTLVLALLLLSPNCYAQTTSATPVKPAIAEKTAEQKKRDDLHARYIMEQIRADIVWFRTGHRIDLIDPGKELWTAARDIFCQEQPAAKYIDLAGVSRVCGTN